MKNILLAALLILILMFCSVSFASTKTLEVQFEYNTPAQAFNLYMDGHQVCNTNTPNVMSCTGIEIPYGVHLFTMTAVVDGVETMHSPAYVWSYAPEPGAAPVFLNFSVVIDGKTVQLGPAN